MTKKDFELIAKAVRSLGASKHSRRVVARAMAEALHSANPRFDELRFMEACLDEEKAAEEHEERMAYS
jgi:hypothetical protein